jgi:putative transposase
MEPIYPSNITEEQFEIIRPWFTKKSRMGRPRIHTILNILNAIFYVLRSGGAWRMLPHDFPKWKTVYHYFRLWKRAGLVQRIHDALVHAVRKAHGKKPTPSAMILDSQSVKAADQAGERGYDAGKKIKGIKRHVMVDTMGLIWFVSITTAAVQDRDGARGVLLLLANGFSRLKKVWADGGYAGALIEWLWRLRTRRRIQLEIVKRNEAAHGFEVLPKRWIVERTFGWLMKQRRLRCHYEQLPDSAKTMMYLAMTRLMLRRLHP